MKEIITSLWDNIPYEKSVLNTNTRLFRFDFIKEQRQAKLNKQLFVHSLAKLSVGIDMPSVEGWTFPMQRAREQCLDIRNKFLSKETELHPLESFKEFHKKLDIEVQ